MTTATLRETYREVRTVSNYTPGTNAVRCLSQARTLLKWRAAERAGYVKLDVEEDQDFQPDEGNCCCEDPDCSAKTGPAFGTVGRYRQDHPLAGRIPTWEQADSVWGHTGYADPGDWRENPYVLDIMAETLEALAISRKAH